MTRGQLGTLILAGVLAGIMQACTGPAAHDNATALRKATTVLRRSTVPNPAYDPVGDQSTVAAIRSADAVKAINDLWATVDADLAVLEGAK